MGWLVLILLLAGGGYAYHFLSELEKEIRAELEPSVTDEAPPFIKTAPAQKETRSESSVELDTILLKAIEHSPDLLQTELYTKFGDIDRKLIQKVLLNLDQSGKILRSRSGNTYRLKPKN